MSDRSARSDSFEDLPHSTCPYLGTLADSNTNFSYPTLGNSCWRAIPPEPVRIGYQSDVCLTHNHESCPLFEAESWNGRLPEYIAARSAIPLSVRIGRVVGILLLILLAAGLIYGVVWLGRGRFSFAGSTPSATLPVGGLLISQKLTTTFQASRAVSATPTRASALLPATPTLEPVAPSPTPTPLPTDTPTPPPPTPGPAEETPFGPGAAYLVHVVRRGESLYQYKKAYNTSIALIRRLNGMTPFDALLPNYPLILMPGQLDETAGEPLKAVFLTSPSSISELASLYQATPEVLRRLNSLGNGDSVPAGRWIIFPNP